MKTKEVKLQQGRLEQKVAKIKQDIKNWEQMKTWLDGSTKGALIFLYTASAFDVNHC